MSDIEVHFLNVSTVDLEGKATGVVLIPVVVKDEEKVGVDGVPFKSASIDPGHLVFYSQDTLVAEARKKYPSMFNDA